MQRSNMPTESDDWKRGRLKGKRKKGRGTFTLEYRVRPEKQRGIFAQHASAWTTYHKRYATERRRDEALALLQRKDDLFEYRLPLGGK